MLAPAQVAAYNALSTQAQAAQMQVNDQDARQKVNAELTRQFQLRLRSKHLDKAYVPKPYYIPSQMGLRTYQNPVVRALLAADLDIERVKTDADLQNAYRGQNGTTGKDYAHIEIVLARTVHELLKRYSGEMNTLHAWKLAQAGQHRDFPKQGAVVKGLPAHKYASQAAVPKNYHRAADQQTRGV
jgi:hypothetical protein